MRARRSKQAALLRRVREDRAAHARCHLPDERGVRGELDWASGALEGSRRAQSDEALPRAHPLLHGHARAREGQGSDVGGAGGGGQEASRVDVRGRKEARSPVEDDPARRTRSRARLRRESEHTRTRMLRERARRMEPRARMHGRRGGGERASGGLSSRAAQSSRSVSKRKGKRT